MRMSCPREDAPRSCLSLLSISVEVGCISLTLEFPVFCLEPGGALSALYVDRNPILVIYHLTL